MKKFLLFSVLSTFTFLLLPILYAQEQVQILTYYPAPYGVYQTLQVGSPGHFLTIDRGDSRNRIYSTYNTDTLMIGHGQTSWDILIGPTGGTTITDLHVTHNYLTNSYDLYVDGANGNIGIGTNIPKTKLHLLVPDDSGLRIQAGQGGWGPARLEFYSDPIDNTNEWRPGYIVSADTGSYTGRLDFYTNGTGSDAKTGSVLGMSIVNGKTGIGTTAPSSCLTVRDTDESTTQTNFTQALTDAGINIVTEMTDAAYTPGLFWSTENNNTSKPKAGIYLKEDLQDGTSMFFGTSNGYSTGITNNAMVINHQGRIGIGTTSPDALLEVQGDGAPIIRGVATGSNNLLQIQKVQTYSHIVDPGNPHEGRPPSFGDITGPIDVFIVTNSGNVGIRSHIPFPPPPDPIPPPPYRSSLEPSHDLELYFGDEAFKPGGGSWGNSSSDIRLKKNVKTIDNALDKMTQLRGVTFKWIEPEKHGDLRGIQMGMIGQEVEKVFPQWVDTDKDGYKTLCFSGFEALTTESLKELKKQIEELKIKNRKNKILLKTLEPTLNKEGVL